MISIKFTCDNVIRIFDYENEDLGVVVWECMVDSEELFNRKVLEVPGDGVVDFSEGCIFVNSGGVVRMFSGDDLGCSWEMRDEADEYDFVESISCVAAVMGDGLILYRVPEVGSSIEIEEGVSVSGAGDSSVVIATFEQEVFVGTFSSNQFRLTKVEPINAFAVLGAVKVGEIVVVLSADGRICCVDLISQEIQWEINIEREEFFCASAAMFRDGYIYVYVENLAGGDSCGLLKIEISTGEFWVIAEFSGVFAFDFCLTGKWLFVGVIEFRVSGGIDKINMVKIEAEVADP